MRAAADAAVFFFLFSPFLCGRKPAKPPCALSPRQDLDNRETLPLRHLIMVKTLLDRSYLLTAQHMLSDAFIQ
jgi:hypothetical protein